MLNSSEELTNFELFCGSTFWDDTLSWNTPNETLPDFTRCFQQTVVSWIPCGFLWVSLPFYLYYLSTVKVEYKQKLSTLSATKTIISLMLAALSLFDLGYTVAVRYYNKDTDSYLYLPPSAYFSTSLEFVTMLLASVLVQSYRLSGKFTSGVLWCYWGLWTLGSVIPFYSEIVHFVEVNSIDDIPEFVTKTVYFSLCLLQFILSCISDANLETRQRFEDVCPELLCSFCSYLTFAWFAPTVSLGYKKDLMKEDLWKLGPDNTSKSHIPAFEADWNAEVARWRHQKENNERYSSVGDDDVEPLIEPLRTPKEPKLSLIRIIANHYGGSLMTGFACKFAYDWIQFTGPAFQSMLIAFVSTRTGELPPGSPVDPVWQGYVIVILLLLCQLTMSVLYQQLWYRSLEVGMRVRASLISVIYKKALKMTSQAKQDSTVGGIVNLMAVDAQRMQDAFQFIWMLWSAPLQIVIALYLLWQTIGASLFVGFGILLISVPISAWISLWQKRIQTRQMKLKDERVRIMNEVLSGIKVIKLYAWEPSFEEKVAAIRKKEMETISRNWTCQALQFSIFTSLSTIVTAATYAVYVCVTPDHMLSATVAFVTLSLFNMLRSPLIQLPRSLSFTVMANVSINRIAEFFKNPDLSEDNVESDDSCDVSIRVSNGTFSWLPDTTKILRNVNLEVPTGSLTAIVGQVGCGKSSLLAACVGDMHKHSGKVVSKGAVAFVAQQAWIQNATVRDNILFGQDFDRKRYDRIVEAVALRPDFRILSQGDLTLIGEKGINLSGGQKQRVSLARACYSTADVFLLDDPLSAVDAHVGKHIFENVIGPNGLLQGKTRVLVTHGIQWLPKVDNIAVMSDSRITESGTYDGLLAQKGPFADFINTYANAEPDENIEERKELETLSRQSKATGKTVVIDAPPKHHDTQGRLSMSAILSMSVGHSEIEGTHGAMTIREDDDVVVNRETVESGNISGAVYKLYIKSMGYLWASLALVNLIGITVFTFVSSIWLSTWTDDEAFLPATTEQYTDDQIWDKTVYYLVVYCVLTIARTIFAVGASFSFAKCSVSASAFLHEMLLSKIMKAQMMFFDTKPLGMILNRFSKDIDAIDNLLGVTVNVMNVNLTLVISTAIIIIYTAPIFVVVVIPAAILFYILQRYFIRTVRQLKRWEAVTRSPIFTHFSETVTGAETIRAFAVQDRFIQKSEDLVEENVLFFYSGWVANRWLSILLQAIAATIIGLTAVFCVVSTQISFLQISSSVAGLALSYALIVTSSLDMLTRNLTDFETNIVSIERVKEYSEVPLEADWIDDDEPPPRQWPARGAIQFRRYATRYRPELDLVLKELDFSIKPQEKVGIVGRTGAGKSSMTLAIFRLIEAARGSIYIDGVNIGAIGLHQLRNKITILPQDPVLFSGSVRDNLDPFHEHEDIKIWEVLEQSFLKEYVERQAGRLEYDCGEGGENLSVGQRQLICLARALLRKTKVLVLDEATAAVDLETDDLIQQTIRTAFADCTILTIAHRLNTIMDSDRILVLDKGKVAEFDTPENLLENKDSLFSGLAVEAGVKVKQNGD